MAKDILKFFILTLVISFLGILDVCRADDVLVHLSLVDGIALTADNASGKFQDRCRVRI